MSGNFECENNISHHRQRLLLEAVGTMCVCKNNKETGKDFGCTNSKNACDALPGSTGTKCKKCGEAIDFSGGFPCSGSGDITLNRLNSGMYPLYDTFGSNCMLRMSPDQSIGNYATSAFVEYDFAPGTDFAFSSTFGYRIYGDMARSADGLTFVIHQDPNGASALGLGGIDMGVYGGSAAIKNSLVIELDTCE